MFNVGQVVGGGGRRPSWEVIGARSVQGVFPSNLQISLIPRMCSFSLEKFANLHPCINYRLIDCYYTSIVKLFLKVI